MFIYLFFASSPSFLFRALSFSAQRRGWEACLTKFDEGAFFTNPTAFLSAFPVCTQRRNAFVIMTTPGPETNYFHYLASATDDAGRPRLKIIRFATICADCRQTAKPWLCPHISDKVDWIGDQDDKAFLYAGNERYRAQELKGLQLENNNFVWSHYVPNLTTAPPHEERVAVRAPMFYAVDPANGGKNRSAVLGGYFLDWGNPAPEHFVVSVFARGSLAGGAVHWQAARFTGRRHGGGAVHW